MQFYQSEHGLALDLPRSRNMDVRAVRRVDDGKFVAQIIR